jgi:prepilin-type N-terminal cleavage/methylation domain-containing protein
MLLKNQIKIKKGFTLVETLVGVAVFLIIAVATYQAYISLFNLINLNQYKIVALNLANEQFEIIRNLPYSDVGIPAGIPNGKIPHVQNFVRSNITFVATTTIRNIDHPFDGQIGSSTKPDLSPADSKSVEIEIGCPSCKNFKPFTLTTMVAPKNLETASTNGAILIKVFDSNGAPVEGASVHIENTIASPDIAIDDVTDIDGVLQVVDAPPGVAAYKITVTKSGYSTDRTYTPGANGNTTPTKPDATVILQQLTPISFAIDQLSTMTFSSVTPTCSSIGGMDISLVSSKMIGVNIPKYSANLITNGSGSLTLPSMEWDSYTITGIDSVNDVIGLNPLNTVALNPGSTQNMLIIVEPKNPRSLLVTVKDSATGLPVTDASVQVTRSGYDVTKTTGRGFINQTDWSGGSGQATSSDPQKYASDDGNVEISSPAGDIKLRNVFGIYNPSAWLESSTIDTGSASNFYNLTWLPINQPVSGTTTAKFQFATATTSDATWNYIGPDGTSGTYYTTPNSTLSAQHSGDRYARYKVYLDTLATSSSPTISDVSFTVTSSCTPPGQVIFSGLSSGTYDILVSKSGYSDKDDSISVSASWHEKEIILSP